MIEGRTFSFGVATEVTFGVGVRHRIGPQVRRFGRRAALVASERGFASSPVRDELEAGLSEAGVEHVVSCRAGGEPTLELAVRAGQEVEAARAEVVVAIGGGSALDLAKAAAVAATGADLRRFFGGERYDAEALPVVAVPTTAGSGAETSQAAIILDEAAAKKRGIRGRALAPRVALVDPELVVTCPSAVTARAGFDAVAHAVETALSRASSPITLLFSLEALSRLLRGLPRSLEAPDDIAARAETSYAAMLMGVNLANSTTCLPHRMQYPIGALTRTEHARGVAALMPAWLSRTRAHAPDRLALLASATGRQRTGTSEDASLVVDAVLRLMDRIQLRPRLRDLGVDRADLPRLAEMVEGAVENDPGPSDRAAILRLYEASY